MKLTELYNEVLREDEGDKLFYHGSPYEFDKFDFSKIGSGDGLNKYGYGLYFADLKETAIYYARELSIGSLKNNGFNLYTVKLYNLNEFYPWDEEIPYDSAQCVINKLNKMGNTSDAELMLSEYEEYGTFWSIENTYAILLHILGSAKETSQFLNICGVSGVISQSPAHNGNIYVVYDDNNIKIVDREKL